MKMTLTPTESGVTFIAAYLESNGATAWTNEWYSVYNFLQYGAPCYVGFNNTTSGLSGFYSLDVDVIFEGATGAKQQTLDFFNHRVSKEAPAFGIFSVTDEITNENLNSTNLGNPTLTSFSSPEFGCLVYGQKKQLNVAGTSANTTLITTTFAADVAGCLARTDRVAYPWISPAGVRRGQILNVVSLAKNLTETQQDNLYDNNINPIASFVGEGTILFGDKTRASSGSSLTSINISRLVIYSEESSRSSRKIDSFRTK
jgi:hypothetical protein